MFSNLKAWKLLTVLTLVVALAGCSTVTPTVVTPTPLPTIDTQPTFNAISTQAAQTVVANLTLNAPSATPIVPTDTPAPTNTAAPTDTPAPTATATRVFIPWTATPTATVAAYGCSVTSVSPKSSDTIKVDQDFDGKWTVKNTGTKTWSAGNTDARYVEGTRFQQDKDLIDLTSDVAPNGTYTITVDMKAPGSDGSYSTTWAIYLEDGSTCNLKMSLNVSK